MFGLERRKKQETRKTFQVAPIWQLYGAGWRMLEIIILVDLATHLNAVVDNGRRCRTLNKQHCVSIQTHHLHDVLSPFHCSTWIFLLLQHWTTCCHPFTTKKNTYLRIVLTIQSITLYKNVICFLRAFGVFYDYAFASLLSEFIRPGTKHCALLLPVTWHLQLSRLKE